MATDHSLLSSYRETLLEHLFAGEVMRHVWLSGIKRLEVLKPQVDDGGYDLVLEGNAIVRHVQLKATFRGSTVGRFNVNSGLELKPSGCVVVVLFEPKTLEIGPFLWFGAPPGQALPPLKGYPVAKHTKGNAQGVELPRPNVRVLPRSAFQKVATIAELAERLFGAPLGDSKKRPRQMKQSGSPVALPWVIILEDRTDKPRSTRKGPAGLLILRVPCPPTELWHFRELDDRGQVFIYD